MATDFLDATRNEIHARLKELKPLAEEHARLEAAAAALENVPAVSGQSAGSPPAGRTRAAQPRRRATAKTSGASAAAGRRGRPKGSGSRGAEALAIVKATPGITIPQIAEKMGIKQNYLYRVLPGLAEDGLVVKDGKGWKVSKAA